MMNFNIFCEKERDVLSVHVLYDLYNNNSNDNIT
jgi:hypothetical protein